MIDFKTAIGAIRDNNGFTANDYEDSYYRTYSTPKGDIQIRISNHGTQLWTWVKNAPIRPDKCYANICIVLSQDGTHMSTTGVKTNQWRGNENNPSGLPYDFEVVQYVYNCSIISPNNAHIINRFIQKIVSLCRFEDPLKTNIDRHAGVYLLRPNKPIKTIISQNNVGVGRNRLMPQNLTITSNNYPSASKRNMAGADYPIEETKTINNMKQTKKITESQLRDMIAESVKKVLNEISLSDYDNGESMSAHYANKLDGYGDEDGNYDNDRQFPDYDSDEDRWDELVHMKNRGLLTDKELEAIAEKLYY